MITSPDTMTVEELKKLPKKMKHVESNIQRSCIKWFDRQYPKLKQLLFAIPNGGSRNIIEASIMKAEGVRRGIPDIFLSMPTGNWAGMYIEMKSEKGYLRPEQKEFIALVGANYKCVVCRSLEDFQREINQYLI
jgi:hypothetical protein